MFGFGVQGVGSLSSVYLLDSYREVILSIPPSFIQLTLTQIVGDSFVAVAFVRNAMSMMITFVLTPWILGMGLKNTFILAGALSLAINALVIPMIFFGKKWRIASTEKYQKFADMQYNPRAI